VALWAVLAGAVALVGTFVYAIWFVPYDPVDGHVSFDTTVTYSSGSSTSSSTAATVAAGGTTYGSTQESLQETYGVDEDAKTEVWSQDGDGERYLLLLGEGRYGASLSLYGFDVIDGRYSASTCLGGTLEDYASYLRTPLSGPFVLTTTECVGEAVVDVCSSHRSNPGAPCFLYGVSQDPGVRDLTISGRAPDGVAEVELGGSTHYVWWYWDLDATSAPESDPGFSFSDFTLRDVMRGLDIRVGDEDPYGK
jgi:hypothetical protein